MKKFASLLFLLFSGVIATYPFAWMFLSSFKTNDEIYQPTLFLPANYKWDAFISLFNASYLPFLRIFSNSLVLSFGQAFLATLISAGAGFCLAKYKFRGRGLVLFVAIFLVLIPKQTLAVPTFDWISWLGWRGSLFSLLLPGAVSGIGVLFFLQVFRRFPQEWIDLARIEGMSPFRTYINLLPLVLPGLMTFFFLHFVLSFQEHLLPLLLLDDENMTLPLALATLKDSSHRIPESVGMAAATLSLVPILIMFSLVFGKMKTALREVTLS